MPGPRGLGWPQCLKTKLRKNPAVQPPVTRVTRVSVVSAVARILSRLLCLLMKPLKLQLCCDCDAELASFPYVRLACGAQAR